MDAPDFNTLKRCSKCGEVKRLTPEYFRRDKGAKDGFHSACKTCDAAYYALNRESITEKSRQYHSEHREESAEYRRGYRAANPDKKRESDRRYRTKNADKIRESNRRYREENAERLRESNHRYSIENADKVRRKTRRWYLANTDRKRESDRRWRAENPERLSEYARRWQRNNPESVRAGCHRRRARKLEAGGSYTVVELAAIRAAQTDKHGRLICWRCGKPIKDAPHLDHWIPLKHGGRNDAGNLHYMHSKCNLTKNSKHPTEIGRLL